MYLAHGWVLVQAQDDAGRPGMANWPPCLYERLVGSAWALGGAGGSGKVTRITQDGGRDLWRPTKGNHHKLRDDALSLGSLDPCVVMLYRGNCGVLSFCQPCLFDLAWGLLLSPSMVGWFLVGITWLGGSATPHRFLFLFYFLTRIGFAAF